MKKKLATIGLIVLSLQQPHLRQDGDRIKQAGGIRRTMGIV